MNKFTPGPWKFAAEGGEVTTDCEVAALIATVNLENTSEEQSKGDGALIAAAPDMARALEAAKVALHLAIQTDDVTGFLGPKIRAAFIATRDEAAAVLANAVGGE